MLMLVGIDIDDVKVDFSRAFYEHYNKVHGTTINYEDVNTYKIEDILKIQREEVKEALNAFYNSNDFKEIEPFEDAKNAIPILSKKHRLVVISSRPEHIHDQTRQWLEYHFAGLYMDVHFSAKNSMKKADICKMLDVEAFIEDNAQYSEEVADIGIKVLLFDRPWNKECVHPGVTRVYSWNDVLKELNT